MCKALGERRWRQEGGGGGGERGNGRFADNLSAPPAASSKINTFHSLFHDVFSHGDVNN